MADTLTTTAAGGSMTATLVGAWELRAGSHDTTEWLDGAADVGYPGGGPGTFQAHNEAADGSGTPPANGYDPAPKMAIISLATVTDACTVTLSGGASAILGSFVSNGDTDVAQGVGANHSGLVITLETDGAVAAAQLLVMYN
jgi:hypothetical protein|tara:strand:- start:461 stop:886 length:426 start_codon:yes stop_codon:yes gene_type:complete